MALFNLVISNIFCSVILIMQNKPYSCHSIRILGFEVTIYSYIYIMKASSFQTSYLVHLNQIKLPSSTSHIAQAVPSSSINWLPRNQYGHMIYCLVIGWACCIKVKSTHGRGPLDLYGNMILDGKNIKPYVTGFYIFGSIYIVWNVNQNISIHI